MAIAQLSIDIEARLANFERNLDNASRQADRFAGKLSSAFTGVGAAVAGLVGVLGVGQLGSMIKTTVDDMDAMSKAAQRVGVSVESLSALNYAGGLSGVQLEELTGGLTKLSVKMQEAVSGNKDAVALFKDLGVAVTNSSGQLRSADDVFADVAEKFAGMADGAGKTAFSVDIFGKSGARLVPLLNGGAEGLANMRREAEQLGGIIDGKLAKQAEAFNDNLERLAITSAAAGRSIAGDLLPWLNEISESFLISIKNSESFWEAINRKNPGAQVVNIQAELAGVRKEFDELLVTRSGRLNEGLPTAAIDKQIAAVKRSIAYYKELQVARVLAESGDNYGNEARGRALGDQRTAPRRTAEGSSAGKSAADEAAKLIARLNEQIGVKQIDLQLTEKMTAAEKEASEIMIRLRDGTLKASDAQKATLATRLESLIVIDKEAAAHADYLKAIESQSAALQKDREGMEQAIETARRAAETYGLSEVMVSELTAARLEEAIAIARQNGAGDEQIAYLERELELRRQLTEALDDVDTKRTLAGTETGKYARQHAEMEALQKKMQAGKLSETEYDEAVNALVGKTTDALSTMDEFANSAARNMQSAMADFFINPTKDGIGGLATSFGQTVQKMIAEAGSAQLMRSLFGNMGGSLGSAAGSSGGAGNWGWVGQAASFIGSFFADGGIMTDRGPLPLRAYAAGGIANTPQLAMFGEGRLPEAYVPLPDGRNIPVKMQGAGGQAPNITIHVNSQTGDKAEIRRSAATGARAALGAMNGARRYG